MSKYLIINADDFGISKSVNSSIISLLNEKRISSATLMPNAVEYEEAAIWGKENSNNIGLHISLMNDICSEQIRSISRKKSLEDDDGYLFEDVNQFNKIPKNKDIKHEIKMQFEKISNSGITISHVDIHRYAINPVKNPFVYIFICKQCKKYDVPIRWCRKGYYFVGEKIPSLCEPTSVSNFFAAISDLYNVPVPDYVFMFPFSNKFPKYIDKKNAFINMINNLPDGICEVHIHPAIETEELKKINPTWKERVFEHKLMLDDDVIRAMSEAGVKLITYKDISKIKQEANKLRAIGDVLYYGSRFCVKKIFDY